MEKRELQAKADAMLAKGIADVEALGIELYDIIPQVRLTDNRRRIGSAQEMNHALFKFGGETRVFDGMKPLFRISVSRSECGNDFDMKNVIYHEILHCAPNCQDHQATWKSHAAKVNAKYGLNVTVTKKSANTAGEDAGRIELDGFIGKCFRDGRRTFRFEGFNGRPKNSCDIVDIATGKAYVCPPGFVSRKMAEAPAMFGASVSAPAARPQLDGLDGLAAKAAALVGKKVKNGPRGRKVFTVSSVDPDAGRKAILLLDEDGCEYTGPLGVAEKLVVLG